MSEKKGIQNTKEVLVLGFAVGNVVKQALSDGKIGLEDLGLLMQLLPVAGPAFNDISEVISEFKDLDVAEAKELLEFAANELKGNYTEEEMVVKIDASLNVGLSVANLVEVL